MPKPHYVYFYWLIMEYLDFMDYEPPLVEIIEVEVEKGFAGSTEQLEPRVW